LSSRGGLAGGRGATGRRLWSRKIVRRGASGGVAVFGDESAEDRLSSDRVDGNLVGCWFVGGVGGSLVETAVGSMAVVMLDVLVEDPMELPLVPDEGAVEDLGAH